MNPLADQSKMMTSRILAAKPGELVAVWTSIGNTIPFVMTREEALAIAPEKIRQVSYDSFKEAA